MDHVNPTPEEQAATLQGITPEKQEAAPREPWEKPAFKSIPLDKARQVDPYYYSGVA